MFLHTLPTTCIDAAARCYSVPRLCEALIAAGVPTKLAVLDWVSGIEASSYVERFSLGVGRAERAVDPDSPVSKCRESKY